jgi:hypothetical protein
MQTREITREYVYGHTFNQAIFEAFAQLATERLAGKEHNANKPKTAMRFEIDEWHTLTFKPQIVSSPTGWKMGSHIRLELRASLQVWGKKGNGCELILELQPDGFIRPRRWWKDYKRTKAAFEMVKTHLDMLSTDPGAAIGRNKSNCAICGRKLTDPESQARGVGPECKRMFEFLVRHMNGEIVEA